MRLALGLGTRSTPSHGGSGAAGPPAASHDGARQRRRFAQDGEVPVVMLHRARDGGEAENRLATLTAELREERAARQKAERAVDEHQTVINALRTKLAHAEMAFDDKLAAEAESRAQFDQLLAQEREARQRAEHRAAEAELALSVRDRRAEAPARRAPPAADLFEVAEPAAPPAAAPRRGRKPKARTDAATSADAAVADEPASEDQPIEWWLPSFRAGRKAPARRSRGGS